MPNQHIPADPALWRRTGTARSCEADACESGRKPCPCPEACHIPVDPELRALVWRAYFAALIAAVVGLVCWPY